MKELFLLIKEKLQKQEPLVLVTLTESSGSAPRGAGARMLVGYDSMRHHGQFHKRLWGSIGGGLPEHLAIEEAGKLLCGGEAFEKKYLLRPNEAADLGAVCGGEVSVFFRQLNINEAGLLELIEKGITCFSEKEAVWFVMEIGGDAALGLTSELDFLAWAGGRGGQSGSSGAPNLNAAFRGILKPGPMFLKEGQKRWLSEPLVSGSFVYIFGGGHISQELVPLLARLDFRCIVFEDREEFLTLELFPQAEKLIFGNFERIGENITLSGKDYAVILTRGHLWDCEVWAFALESPAAYIGIIGSKTKHEYVKKRLEEKGFTPEIINASRVHAPIGVNIKSESPAEIAVSISAELIHVRAQLRKED